MIISFFACSFPHFEPQWFLTKPDTKLFKSYHTDIIRIKAAFNSEHDNNQWRATIVTFSPTLYNDLFGATIRLEAQPVARHVAAADSQALTPLPLATASAELYFDEILDAGGVTTVTNVTQFSDWIVALDANETAALPADLPVSVPQADREMYLAWIETNKAARATPPAVTSPGSAEPV